MQQSQKLRAREPSLTSINSGRRSTGQGWALGHGAYLQLQRLKSFGVGWSLVGGGASRLLNEPVLFNQYSILFGKNAIISYRLCLYILLARACPQTPNPHGLCWRTLLPRPTVPRVYIYKGVRQSRDHSSITALSVSHVAPKLRAAGERALSTTLSLLQIT